MIIRKQSVAEDETIKVTVEYKGKTYSSTRRFTDLALKNDKQEIMVEQASDAATRCMRDALEDEYGDLEG